MIWGVLFLLPSRKISQTVAPLIKIVALIWQDFGATFWRFLTQKVAPSDSKHLASLALSRDADHLHEKKVCQINTANLFWRKFWHYNQGRRDQRYCKQSWCTHFAWIICLPKIVIITIDGYTKILLKCKIFWPAVLFETIYTHFGNGEGEQDISKSKELDPSSWHNRSQYDHCYGEY